MFLRSALEHNVNSALYKYILLLLLYDASLFYVCCSDSVGVCGNVCCVAAVVKDSVF